MDLNRIQKALRTGTFGRKIHFEATVDSTNAWAQKTLNQGAGRGEIFLTDEQTAGRGRLDRRWESTPERDILLSIIDIPTADPAQIPQLNLVTGLAFCEALKTKFPKLPLGIKWPNDLWVGMKKLGGVLSEYDPASGKVIIGIGLNVNADTFSSALKGKATSLKLATGAEQSREEIIAAGLNHYEKWRELYDREGLSPVIEGLDQFSTLNGKRVRVTEGNETYEGKACGLNREGNLQVETKTGKRAVIAGDIVLL